jgi:hypothetical protein
LPGRTVADLQRRRYHIDVDVQREYRNGNRCGFLGES